MPNNNCCKGCAERKVTLDYNCHSHCEKFKVWQEELKREKEIRKKNQYYVPRYLDWNCCKKF